MIVSIITSCVKIDVYYSDDQPEPKPKPPPEPAPVPSPPQPTG